MNPDIAKLCEGLIPPSYVKQGVQARHSHENKIRVLVEKVSDNRVLSALWLFHYLPIQFSNINTQMLCDCRVKFPRKDGMNRQSKFVWMSWLWWTATISLEIAVLENAKLASDARLYHAGTTGDNNAYVTYNEFLINFISDWAMALVVLATSRPFNRKQPAPVLSWSWRIRWLWMPLKWQVFERHNWLINEMVHSLQEFHPQKLHSLSLWPQGWV